MKKELFDSINDAVSDRQTWADRQAALYVMRNGPHSRPKSYPGAPNVHYPQGDILIEKSKPSYIQQFYGSETIASFVCLKEQDRALTSSAAQWFDYQLKQRSNFEEEHYIAIDQMHETGFCPIKVYWDAECKKLAFCQIDPLHLIVPYGTQNINTNGGADWVTHVLHMSEDEYRANPRFNQDDDFIKRIKGKGRQDDLGQSDYKRQMVELKEGINCSANENEIVLWEVYKKDRKEKRITVYTISPLLGYADEHEVREPFGLPYCCGAFKGGKTFPFYRIRAEIKGKGYYSSRGTMEINAPFEALLTKGLNTQLIWQDYMSKPMFTSDNPIPNAGNFKSVPGSILPQGLSPVTPPVAPASIMQEMSMYRAISEERAQIPDFSASEHLTGKKGQGDRVTATQINAVVGQSGQGTDMKQRVFKLDLAEGLNLAWSIALQYLVGELDETGQPDRKSLIYIVDSELQQADIRALHDDYDIKPNGSADSWNKGAMVQKRMGYFQTFQGSPYIRQDEMTKWLIEAEDPSLVKRLYQDPGDTEKDQEEQQAMECLVLDSGYPARVHPADDDKAHLMILDQSSQDKIVRGTMTPEMAQARLQHGTEHMGALFQKKDRMLKAVEAKLRPTAEALAMIAAQATPSNVVQMQQNGGNSTDQQHMLPSRAGSPSAAPSSSNEDKPSQVISALASAFKAGLPVTEADFSAALVKAGLPPIISPPITPSSVQLALASHLEKEQPTAQVAQQ